MVGLGVLGTPLEIEIHLEKKLPRNSNSLGKILGNSLWKLICPYQLSHGPKNPGSHTFHESSWLVNRDPYI